MKFFDEVAREGGDVPLDEDLAASPLAHLFNKASVFTVWRPTSDEAIKNMMLGVATGKGLDIKGKSAKRGNISSFVPFIKSMRINTKKSAAHTLGMGRLYVSFTIVQRVGRRHIRRYWRVFSMEISRVREGCYKGHCQGVLLRLAKVHFHEYYSALCLIPDLV